MRSVSSCTVSMGVMESTTGGGVALESTENCALASHTKTISKRMQRNLMGLMIVWCMKKSKIMGKALKSRECLPVQDGSGRHIWIWTFHLRKAMADGYRIFLNFEG